MSEGKLRLTRLGEHARLYGVQTSPGWWRQQFRDATEVMDQDGDWEQLLQERRDGLDQLLHDLRDHGLDWFNTAASHLPPSDVIDTTADRAIRPEPT